MARIPDELQRLKDQYDRLVADATSGAISRDDAYRLLAQLTVIDSAGCQWGLNDEGEFTRRRNPAEPPTVTNPGAFAPAAVSARPVPAPAPVASSAPPEHSMSQEPPAGRIATPFERRGPEKHSVRVDALKARLLRRPATLAVVVLIAASTLLSALTQRGATPVAATTTTTAVAPAGTQPVTAPTDADVQRVFAALTTDAATAATVIVGGTTDPAALAQWAGFRVLGFQVRAETIPAGTAVQRWLLVDTTGSPQLSFNATWVYEAGTWKIAAWPQPA